MRQKKQAGATVTLQANRRKAFAKLDQQRQEETKQKQESSKPKLNLAQVSVKTAQKITRNSLVKSYNLTNSTPATARSFDVIETTNSMSVMQRPNGAMGEQQDSNQVSLSGVLELNLVTSFSDGSNKIISGRELTSDDQNSNNVVIEQQLAKQNDLKVGDMLKVEADKTKKLKIVGIYKATSSQMLGMMSDPANVIYASYTLINNLTNQKGKVQSATYNLTNPIKAKTFIKAAKKQINTNKLTISTDDMADQAIKVPLNNVKSFANKIVWLVCLAGTIILTLLVVLMVRERRHEIGILMALGEKRHEIIAQFLAEMLTLMILALALAGIGGKFVANALGIQLLTQQTTSMTTNFQKQAQGPNQDTQAPTKQRQVPQKGQQKIPIKQEKIQLAVKVDVIFLLKLSLVSAVIVFLAIILGAIGILRMQPKKILVG